MRTGFKCQPDLEGSLYARRGCHLVENIKPLKTSRGRGIKYQSSIYCIFSLGPTLRIEIMKVNKTQFVLLLSPPSSNRIENEPRKIDPDIREIRYMPEEEIP